MMCMKFPECVTNGLPAPTCTCCAETCSSPAKPFSRQHALCSALVLYCVALHPHTGTLHPEPARLDRSCTFLYLDRKCSEECSR